MTTPQTQKSDQELQQDVLEELVGEVDDEHDAARPTVEQRRTGLVLSGLLRDDEVDEVAAAVHAFHPRPVVS